MSSNLSVRTPSDAPVSILQLKERVDVFSRDFTDMDAHSVISSVHELCTAIEHSIQFHDREIISDVLQPAWRLHAHSPFIHRLQTWPRGYQGDFETIEWLSCATPRLQASTPAYWLEWYALNAPIAQQHRNKLIWQRSIIERAARRGGRILNVGCGGCADLSDSPPFIDKCDFIIIDMDQDALELSSRRLKGARSLRVIKRDILRGIRDAMSHGPFDAIVCGGLFDYLSDSTISKLLNQFDQALDHDGCIAFTNISDHNPYRIWMENLANWTLLHRSEADIVRIASDAQLDLDRLTINKETSGTTFLCKYET